MVVKGLPDSYKPFVVHITQTNDIVTFSEFKTKRRSYESTEKYGKSDGNVEEDNVTSGATWPRGRGRGKKMNGLMSSVTHVVKRDTLQGHVMTDSKREGKNENGTHHSEAEGAAEDEIVSM